jgi:hypothetical protein
MDGRISTAMTTSSGSGATNTHRHPIVEARSAPSGGPRIPGRIHIEAKRASTRGRILSG